MSNKKSNKNVQKEKNNMLTVIIAVITTVIIVSLICAAIIISKSKSPKDDSTAYTPQNGTQATAQSMIKKYEHKESGTVSEKESKAWAYFNSHYQDDYYRVNELAYSVVVDGSYTEYYETNTVAYSTQGYLYSKKVQSSYEEQDLSGSIVELYTPEKSYIIYPDMKSYFAGDTNTQNYSNTIDFPGDTFKTGTININGMDYYYEEMSDENGVTYRYCFDKNNDLKFRISSSTEGTITERYIEYSKDVDYSLFEIPEDYTLEG